MVRVGEEVADALAAGRPVVALESSVFAQGLPVPANREACERMVEAIVSHGATPAVTAVVGGRLVVGLADAEVERFLRREGIVKVGARDLAAAATLGVDGATTVSASLVLAERAGIAVFATGGIGGVHRGDALDESADLIELSRVSVICVCAGAKAILDLRATAERLETLSVAVLGFRTDWFPEFYCAGTTIPVSWKVGSPDQIARVYARHVSLGMPGAVLVVNPPPEAFRLDKAVVDRAVDAALAQVRRAGIAGRGVTPALLESVERETSGASLQTNIALLESNAALAARIAVALAAAEKNR